MLDQLSLESCVAVNVTSGTASLFLNGCIRYQGVYIYNMAPVAVVVLASFSPTQLQLHTQIVFAPRVCTLVLFIIIGLVYCVQVVLF